MSVYHLFFNSEQADSLYTTLDEVGDDHGMLFPSCVMFASRFSLHQWRVDLIC